MGKVIVNMSITLDGVIQAPGRADEDTRGGFKYGGWAVPYFDPVMFQTATEGMSKAPSILLGRRTYEDFYKVWPNRTDNPFTEILNKAQKYVASRTLKEPLPWVNSTLLAGDAGDAVAVLKQQHKEDVVILGSGELVRSLMSRNLIDEYILSIHPLVLGSGWRLFPEGSPYTAFRAVNSKTASTGVVIVTYQPAQPLAGKDFIGSGHTLSQP